MMHCQRCRAPLRLHSSVSDLNPASFHLLTNGPSLPEGYTRPSRQFYHPARRERYEDAARSSRDHSEKQDLGFEAHKSKTGDHNDAANHKQSTMSFHNITASQVVPPAEAERLSQQVQRKKASRRESKSDRRKLESQASNQSPSSRVESAERLFEILSSRSDVDHPVCTDCMELLVEQMEKRLTATERQRDAYIDFLKNAHADMPTAEETDKTAADLVDCRREEAATIRELEDLEKQKSSLEEEVADLDRQSKELDAEEAKFWHERNAFTTALTELQDQRESVNLRYEHDKELLKRLQRAEVYNDTFSISHDGKFATINGLRLGRLSSPTVEWAEINAAWGIVVLLLDTLAEKLDLTFRGYKLHSLGSTSSIERLPGSASSSPSATRASTTSVKSVSASTGSDSAKQQSEKPEQLPLHRGEHVPIVSTFIHRGFDQGMIAFLECLRQLGRHVEKVSLSKGNRQFKIPYEIKKDRIDNDTIKLGGFGYDDTWTRACKHVLTYLKMILAFTRDFERTGDSDG